MKRIVAILAIVLTISACKAPKKPWSPYSDDGSQSSESSSSAPLPVAAPTIDIGDAEQGIYIEAKLAPESQQSGIKAEELQDIRKYVTKLTVNVPETGSSELWVDYSLRCSRNFVERPVVLRAEVKVEGQTVDTIVAVLGANAKKNTYTKKINLFKNFATPPPTMLATVTGSLLLMPEGAAEGSINPETAESSISSPALQFTLVRVNTGATVSAEEVTQPEAVSSETAPPAADTVQ
ncbi:MAG: hypothetical protein K1Y02_11135 [Candidatus Hydrogenedentes bacterium]|nr:hypothetical protein [Candidatus Hydrogenedentota bacterium]